MLSFIEYTQIMKEMSELITFSASPPHFTDSKNNKTIYDSVKKLENKKLLYKLTDYANIYIIDNALYCVDDNLQRITYYMWFKIEHDVKLGGEFAYQQVVWSEQDADLKQKVSYLKGVPIKVIYDFLLSKYKTITNSQQQSHMGRNFWFKIIETAFVKKLNVYHYNPDKNQLTKIDNSKEWEQYQKSNTTIWEFGNEINKERIVITSKKLEELK